MGSAHEAESTGTNKRVYRSPLRAESAARTRALIRDAATELFAERGFVSTTIRQVAQRAGVAPRTVALAFPTKAALFEEALQVATTGAEDATPEDDRLALRSILDETDCRQLLGRVAASHMEQLDRCGELLLRCYETSGSDDDMRRIREEREERVMSNCGAIARTLAQRGALQASLSTEEATDILFALADPGIHQRLRRTRQWPKPRYLTWATNLLVNSLLAPERHNGSAAPRD